MVNRLFSFASLVLFSMFLVSCSYFDRINIELTSPPDNFRATEELPEGAVPYVPVNIRYDGTKTSNTAQIIIDGVPVGTCALYVGENVCGTYSVSGIGQHTVMVQVQKDDGTLVTDQATFTWKPYTMAEKAIQFVSGKTGNGFLVVVAIAIVSIVLLSIKMLKSINVWAFALLALVVISLVFLAPAMFGGVEALVSIKALQSFLIKVVGGIATVIIIVSAMKYGYTLRLPSHTQVSSIGEKGRFDGSHTSLGEIGTGTGRNEAVEALYHAAEKTTNGHPNLIETASRQLLGSGVKNTRVKQPSLLARFLFGSKSEERDVVDGEILK